MGLLDKIKADVKKGGQNKGKFLFVREGQKVRIRFLTDLEDGREVVFHDSFEKNINVPCQEEFNKPCEYCDEEGLRTRSQYIWSVWDYEAKEVKLLKEAVNSCSPVPALMAMYENYGTMLDRDYVLTVNGKGASKTYTVVPMDKVKFRNEKAKAISEKALLSLVNKAFPDENSNDDDDDDYEEPKTKAKAKRKTKAKPEPEPEDDYDMDEETTDYTELTPKELYLLCKEREIEAVPKKPAKFYINLLEADDKAHDDWDDDADDDDDSEWED